MLKVKYQPNFYYNRGSNCRLIIIDTSTKEKYIYLLPIKHAQSSQGAFSLAINNKYYLVTGGDYANDNNIDSVACIVNQTPTLATKGPAGYQSSIEYIDNDFFISTGTSGTNISTDGGKVWVPINDASYNVCRKATKGNLILLAGNNGSIAVFNK